MLLKVNLGGLFCLWLIMNDKSFKVLLGSFGDDCSHSCNLFQVFHFHFHCLWYASHINTFCLYFIDLCFLHHNTCSFHDLWEESFWKQMLILSWLLGKPQKYIGRVGPSPFLHSNEEAFVTTFLSPSSSCWVHPHSHFNKMMESFLLGCSSSRVVAIQYINMRC